MTDNPTSLATLTTENAELKLTIEELKLKLLQKDQDLDDTLYVIYRVLNLIGLNFDNIRDAQLKQVLKGLNKMIFQATTDQEAFSEQFNGFWQLALKIADKYEERTKQVVAARTK
jgi:hypothetical protein